MERNIILTADGSHSISVPEMNVTYHSVHGAIQESLHVFIETGFIPLQQKAGGPVHILEMGLGTGLNALLTLLEADKRKQVVHYTAIELFPLSKEEMTALNYCEQLNRSHHRLLFEKMHEGEWDRDLWITPFFNFHKTNKDLVDYSTDRRFHLVYFDAFAPNTQPELWTASIFEQLSAMMEPGASLVTYCSKGDVRRAMQAAGWSVEKIPGPAGKREMLRASC